MVTHKCTQDCIHELEEAVSQAEADRNHALAWRYAAEEWFHGRLTNKQLYDQIDEWLKQEECCSEDSK